MQYKAFYYAEELDFVYCVVLPCKIKNDYEAIEFAEKLEKSLRRDSKIFLKRISKKRWYHFFSEGNQVFPLSPF